MSHMVITSQSWKLLGLNVGDKALKHKESAKMAREGCRERLR